MTSNHQIDPKTSLTAFHPNFSISSSASRRAARSWPSTSSRLFMGVIAARHVDGELEVSLVRNHERARASAILAPARYDAMADLSPEDRSKAEDAARKWLGTK